MLLPMRSRIAGLSIAVFTALFALNGCVSDKNENPPTTPLPTKLGDTPSTSAGGKKFVVGFAQANSKDPWRQAQNASLVEANKSFPDIELKMQDAAKDNQVQIGQVENFLTQKINLLLISPNESAPLTPAVDKVYDAKIPVVIMDRATADDKFTTYIGGDNVEIGKEAGQYIIEKSKGTGNIVEIWGMAAVSGAKERHSGFADAIASSPGLKVVAHQDCGFERGAARTYMENVIANHTPFTIIYAHNDEMALGALAALKAAHKDPKQYIIVGVDGVQAEVVNAIKAGEMSATFKYPWLGPEAMQAAHDILTGKTLPKIQKLPTERVTIENADAYLAKLPQAAK